MQQDCTEGEPRKACVARRKIRTKEMERRDESKRSDSCDREYERYGARGQLAEERRKQEESSIPTKPSSIRQESLEEKSAIKIQARVRGYLVRKKQQTARLAATKIQAGFRGFKTRKLLKQSEQ